MERSNIFVQAKSLVDELVAAHKPRLLTLEPLCKLFDKDVNSVSGEDKYLADELTNKKADIRKQHVEYSEGLHDLVNEYESPDPSEPIRYEEGLVFFLDAVMDALNSIDNKVTDEFERASDELLDALAKMDDAAKVLFTIGIADEGEISFSFMLCAALGVFYLDKD